jgi:hypothetical protein
VAQVELLGSEYNPDAASAETKAAAETPKKKTMGERIRSLGGRGRKGDQAETPAKGKASKPARRTAKKVTTPRREERRTRRQATSSALERQAGAPLRAARRQRSPL